MDGNGARRSPPDRARALPAEAGEPASDKVPILAADALAGRDAEREPDAVFFPSMLKDARGAARSHVSGSNRALVNQPTVRETDGWAHAGADDEPLSAAQWLQHKVGAWRIWKLDPTLSQRQMGGLAAVSVLGLIGFMFGGQPDTRNDFSCAAWENVITKFQNSRQFEDATLIVGHATRCGICVALVLRQRWCQCAPVRASACQCARVAHLAPCLLCRARPHSARVSLPRGLVNSNMAILRKGAMAPGIHSRMPIASATKWVTAATVMLLVENGTLALSDPPSKYLPWWRAAGAAGDERGRVTLHHLLSMTSGLARPGTLNCTRGATRLEDCARAVYRTNAPSAAAGASVQGAVAVGDEFAYSGNHLVVAAAMAEAATGLACVNGGE